MKNKVLVVAAHPDDEALGCGATMARHAAAGDEVHVLILAEGLTSRSENRSAARWSKNLADLAKAAHKANRLLGTKSLTLHNFPDNRMDGVNLLDVVKVIEKKIDEVKPTILYTHHAEDVNIDHRIAHQAVLAACRPQPNQNVNTLYFFEIPSSTDYQVGSNSKAFSPTRFVEVSGTFARKMKALSIYGSEMRPWPHSRSLKAIEHLARWRGASVGLDVVESFVLGRRIVKRGGRP